METNEVSLKEKPILIAGPPRCGTTMLAGLLGKHGVWIGKGRTTHFPETNVKYVSENQEIKRLLKDFATAYGYTNWYTPIPYLFGTGDLKKMIDNLVPDDTEWLLKTTWTLIFSEFFKRHYPNARWVFPWRYHEDILDSMNRHPAMRKRGQKQKINFIHCLQERQKELIEQVNGIWIDVKKVSYKNHIEIEKLFGFVGIRYDWNIVEDWVQPERMRHGKKN